MTDPRTTHHGDNPRENRGIGQRIMDAVLGDPADPRHDDPADVRRDDRDRAAGDVATGAGGDGPRGEYASYEQAMRDHTQGGATLEDRGTGRDSDTVRDPAGYDPADDARRDAGQAGYTDDTRRDAGRDAYVDRGEAARDAGYDVRDTAAGADRDDPGYGRQAAGTAVDDRARTGARTDADRDVVTGGDDLGRDSEYDSQTAGALADPAAAPVARSTHGETRGDADYDTARDTGNVDDPRGDTSRDYDPAQDTGYVDASRAEADRTTGRRDDDYDTGRVDTAGQDTTGQDTTGQDTTGRVTTERVDQDRADTHRGAGAAAGAGAGAVAAAAFGGGRGDTDRATDRDAERVSDRGAGFSDVDDTATVDSTDTGRSTPDAGSGAEAGIADEDGESGGRERLVPADRADDYGSRWDALKGDFVDEPRRAVRKADELVGELLDELQRLFADQRHTLEQGFDHEGASTEDLRLALRRYRSFFDRLLSF